MKLSPAFANLAWAASNWRGYRQFRRALAHPGETQQTLLRRLLARHADSAYGRTHDFAAIRSYDEFARRVPLVDYENIEPWIRRIQRGESGVLTSDPVQHLIPTSGSVGARKLIPFTGGLQADFSRALGPWISDLFRQQPDLAFGPSYWSITPSIRLEDESSAVPIGFDDDSRYLGGFRRCLVDSVMAVPSALRLVSDIEDFRHLTLLCLLRRRDLRLISVWHPSFLTLLLDALPQHWDELLRDLHSGRCARAERWPLTVRTALRLQPMPSRATGLQQADPRRPETLWPLLKLISCWRDAHAELAAHELERRFPNTVIQAKGLLATEAFVTIPFAGQHPVALRSHFFEFIDDDGELRLAHELREGECYDVVATTSGGLWRYQLHDRVHVTGFLEQTPSLRFLGKSNNISDRFGEKLSEAFVGQVIREVTATLPTQPRFAMLAPEEDQPIWRYTLYLEGPSSPDLARRLDVAMRKNPHYAWCRDLGQLREVEIVSIEFGGYEAFVAREMKHGRRLGEIKPVALSARSGWMECFQCAQEVTVKD
jgi:hypothetical protein